MKKLRIKLNRNNSFFDSASETETSSTQNFPMLPANEDNLENFISYGNKETLKTNFIVQGDCLKITKALQRINLNHKDEFNVQMILLQRLSEGMKLYLNFGKNRKYISWLSKFFPECVIKEPTTEIKNFRSFALQSCNKKGNKFFEFDVLREIYNYLAMKANNFQIKQSSEKNRKKRRMNNGQESSLPPVAEDDNEEEKSESIHSNESRSEEDEYSSVSSLIENDFQPPLPTYRGGLSQQVNSHRNLLTRIMNFLL